MVSGNFAFLTTTLPLVYDDCRRAESSLTTDPRSACFYSRRAIEELVGHLYDVLALPPPYKDDLAVLTNDAGFENVTGNGINAKLNLIRKLGNTAVHQAQAIPAHAALSVLRELFHVTIWAAFRYSLHPGSVPTGAQFDPALAAKAAPLSREERSGSRRSSPHKTRRTPRRWPRRMTWLCGEGCRDRGAPAADPRRSAGHRRGRPARLLRGRDPRPVHRPCCSTKPGGT